MHATCLASLRVHVNDMKALRPAVELGWQRHFMSAVKERNHLLEALLTNFVR